MSQYLDKIRRENYKRAKRHKLALIAEKKRAKAEIRRNQGPVALCRRWGAPSPSALRYSKVEKGIYWYWLARFVRLRDSGVWRRCISCDQPKAFKTLQAGHFAPAGNCGFSLLFDLQNINGECGGCNAFDGGHLIGYAANLNKRYGLGTAEELTKRYQAAHYQGQTSKEWSKEEYIARIRVMVEKCQIYKDQKAIKILL